ncbi:TNF receptor-associated factor 4-like [Stylophora pistillata]|uniref:TNF receptor-associated factor 4-like n=1 Tax=Stylophora pistillata TaxID=50429 RepID=UPI000C04FDD3|nr:TNF receptor-associated factor 4-like [Stylophora pistillata]
MERKILSFAIICPSDGCEWIGELRNKETHLNTCLFKVIPCTNENCLEEVQRQQHEQHVTATCQWRILKCNYCSEPHPECQMQVSQAPSNLSKQLWSYNFQGNDPESYQRGMFTHHSVLFLCSDGLLNKG